MLSGILPAWRAARGGLATAGRQTTTADRAQHRLRAGLVVAEVALALVLVSGAGLLVRSFVSLMSVDPGFQRDRVAVLQVFAWDHNPKPADLRTFFDRAMAKLAALPAVQQVGAVSAMPFIESNINIQNVFAIERTAGTGAGRSSTRVPKRRDTRLFRGHADSAARRPPARAPRWSRRQACRRRDSDSLARRYWPSLDAAIGQTLSMRFIGVAGAGRNRRRRRFAPARHARSRVARGGVPSTSRSSRSDR